MTVRKFGGSMIKGSVVDRPEVFNLAKLKAETIYRTRVHSMLIHINRAVTMATAVWEGETLVNWKWSADTPDLSHRSEIRSPPAPGRTSAMTLGEEPRRAANMQPVTESLLRILAMKKVPNKIYFTNTGEVAVMMEYGMAPGKNTARTKGMLRIAVREATLFAGRL